MVIKISNLTEADIPGAVAAVQDAFKNDPYNEWVYDHSKFNQQRNATSLGIRMRWGMRNGIFHVAKEDGSDKVLGVAMWLRPQPANSTPTWNDWLEGWRLYFNQVGMNLYYGRGGLNVKRYYIWKDAQAKVQSEIWDDPRGYYFLNIMVVLPETQGKGVGAAMMKQVTDQADAENMKCYLESSRDDPNIAIYGRWGFKFVKDMICDDDGPKSASGINRRNSDLENLIADNDDPGPKGSAYVSQSSAAVLEYISKAILEDPGLPRKNPTVSSWQIPEHPTVASIQSTTLPECTDVVIIGSGITGCSVAKTLLEHQTRGLHVTVLEARTLVSGATGRNGGHLVTASGHTFGPLAEQHGIEAAKQVTKFSLLNIEAIMKMVRKMDKEFQDHCQLRDVLKVMAVGDEETWANATSSVLNFQKNVTEHNEYHSIVEKHAVPERWNIKNSVGAVEHKAGAVWPYRLITGIFERLLKKYPGRLAVETHTPATDVQHLEKDKEYPYTVTTPRGTIKAKRIIHCTNGHASHLLPKLAGRIYPFRGTMSVQKPGPLLKSGKGSRSWSLSHKPSLDPRTGLYITGLYYLQENPLTSRIWIGNETAYLRNILTSDDTYVPDEARAALSTILPKLFLKGWGNEETAEIESMWSGTQGHTADNLPVVGKIPASLTGSATDSEQWIAAGFNGYGMDKCWLTGEALVRIMLGEDHIDAGGNGIEIFYHSTS
ncbi:unnamed protein product [Clonostachys rosea f. rosea IK726]|uniref:Uncharacterized protein n=1 Tax=Clonostachys rosea f. rosea IK726 TaxID=1349383 RepID=A0ACA9UU99_BIOOC|nr:unnamed protein product [Clonostachys rosea f. rosea IK726]